MLYLDAGSVLAFTVNTDGSLTRLTDPHDLGIGPLLVASSPFLLAEHSGPFSTDLVVAKATIPSGDLALVSSAGLPVIGSSPFAFLNVCGNEVFAGNDLQAAGMFSISTDGQLTLKGPAISYAGIPSATVTDSTCKFLYVPDTASGEIHVYQNTSGILSEIGPSPFIAGHAVGGKGFFGIITDPSGKFLYVANQGEANIYGFTLNADGSLTPIASLPLSSSGTLVATVTASVASTSYLYATDSTNNKIVSFRIDSVTGGLTLASSANTDDDPRFLISSGGFLYSTNVGGFSISGFTLNGDGTMTPVPGSPTVLPVPPDAGAAIVTAP